MIKTIYKTIFGIRPYAFVGLTAMSFAIMLSSCNRDDDPITETARYSPDDIRSYADLFKVFWNVMDDEYNYFYEEKDRHNLDWDAVYAEYMPKFKALESWGREGYSNDFIAEEADMAKTYFEEIINSIIDRHFNVRITLPASRTVNYSNTYFGEMNEDRRAIYNKPVTMNFMEDKLEDIFKYSSFSGARQLGGRLQSAPDIYYFSFNSFVLSSLHKIDLSGGDRFLFEDPRADWQIDRSELMSDTGLNAIENVELREFIRDWTLEVFNAWNEALTTTLRSETLEREAERFNNSEILSEELLEEANRLNGIINELPDFDFSFSQLPFSLMDAFDSDENAQNYVDDFSTRMNEMQYGYNMPVFRSNLSAIASKSAIYRSFFNPLHSGEIKKLILDLRGNGGGAVLDARFFTERLVTKEALVGYQRTKEGNGRFNYTPWVPMHTSPHPFGIPADIPIVILTDKGSASMSELSTLTLKSQGDQVKSVGDYSAGATAGLGNSDDFNGGARIVVGGFLEFYMPLMATKDVSGRVIEGIGVEPEVYVAPPTEEEVRDMANNPEHRDRTLEKAIEVISGM
ncbi:S41 family peptidase [Sinomicrobium sp. M5D2P17]